MAANGSSRRILISVGVHKLCQEWEHLPHVGSQKTEK